MVDATKELWIQEGFSDKVTFVQILSEREYVTARGRIKYKALRWECVHGSARWSAWLVASEQGKESEAEVRRSGREKPGYWRALQGSSQIVRSIWIIWRSWFWFRMFGVGSETPHPNKLTVVGPDSTLSSKVIGHSKRLAFILRWETFGGFWAEGVIWSYFILMSSRLGLTSTLAIVFHSSLFLCLYHILRTIHL